MKFLIILFVVACLAILISLLVMSFKLLKQTQHQTTLENKKDDQQSKNNDQ